ncbi:hypothetical protein R3P38DRAFT_2816166 [Favolaschia claudopus]|uniref:Uncharacterized protein n=1 Tax=Favolaschia claudopus TaxID=2862362 RepID=A0AAV9Z1L2_9AGAR
MYHQTISLSWNLGRAIFPIVATDLQIEKLGSRRACCLNHSKQWDDGKFSRRRSNSKRVSDSTNSRLHGAKAELGSQKAIVTQSQSVTLSQTNHHESRPKVQEPSFGLNVLNCPRVTIWSAVFHVSGLYLAYKPTILVPRYIFAYDFGIPCTKCSFFYLVDSVAFDDGLIQLSAWVTGAGGNESSKEMENTGISFALCVRYGALRNLIYGQTSTSSAGLLIVWSASLPATCTSLSQCPLSPPVSQLASRCSAPRADQGCKSRFERRMDSNSIEVGRDAEMVARWRMIHHRGIRCRRRGLLARYAYTSNGFARYPRSCRIELFRRGAPKTARREEETYHLPSSTWGLSMTCLDSPVVAITKICPANQLPHPDITHALVYRPVESMVISYLPMSTSSGAWTAEADNQLREAAATGTSCAPTSLQHPAPDVERPQAAVYRLQAPPHDVPPLPHRAVLEAVPPSSSSPQHIYHSPSCAALIHRLELSPAEPPSPVDVPGDVQHRTGHKETSSATVNDPHTSVSRTISTRPLAPSNRARLDGTVYAARRYGAQGTLRGADVALAELALIRKEREAGADAIPGYPGGWRA